MEENTILVQEGLSALMSLPAKERAATYERATRHNKLIEDIDQFSKIMRKVT